MFYHSILDVFFQLWKNLFCHDAVTQRSNRTPVLLTTYEFFISKFHGTAEFISHPRSIPGS